MFLYALIAGKTAADLVLFVTDSSSFSALLMDMMTNNAINKI